MRTFLELLAAAAAGLVLAVILKTFVVGGFIVNGDSMLPTLYHKDFVLGEKISYKRGQLEYGDIVIVDANEGSDTRKIIKRVVGLPGDTVEIKEGALIRNGKHVEEAYIAEKMRQDYQATTLEEGFFFALGDNRNNSADSRTYGAFSFEQIQGKVFVRLFDAFDLF